MAHVSIIIRFGFQSTPPVKAATEYKGDIAVILSISIHAAREGGDGNSVNRRHAVAISIHAAREGGDF